MSCQTFQHTVNLWVHQTAAASFADSVTCSPQSSSFITIHTHLNIYSAT